MNASRRGFTLLELLMVVGIFLLLAVITTTVLRLSQNNDKVRTAARQVQSLLEGARDRAIYSKQPRGVRFLIDPTNRRTVSSMVYVQPTPPTSMGMIQLERLDADNDGVADGSLGGVQNVPAMVVRGFDFDPVNTNDASNPTHWKELFDKGILLDGAQIRIPNNKSGQLFAISTALLKNATAQGVSSYYPPRLLLTTPWLDAPTVLNPAIVSAFAQTGGPRTYHLELGESILPNSDIVPFPKGTVIHLDRSTSPINLEQINSATPPARGDKLPSSWKTFPTVLGDPTNFDYSSTMSIMFSPRGIVTGPSSSKGLIHLYIADQKDADRDSLVYWNNVSNYPTASTSEYGTSADGYSRGDKAILTVSTRTGRISTHSVASVPGDPFKFAETGDTGK